MKVDPPSPASPLRTLLRSSLALVFASLFFGACSSADTEGPSPYGGPDLEPPKPLALRPDAVTADQHFSDTVNVGDGQLTVPVGAADPTGGNEALLSKIDVGTVLAGNRDTASPELAESKNPYGFLRRVIRIERQADQVVVRTQQAYLDELFREGDLVWDAEHATPSIFDGAGGSIVPQSLKPLANDGAGTNSGSGSVAANTQLEDKDERKANQVTVGLSNARVGMDARFTGHIKIREFWGLPYGVKTASAKLDLDPVVAADITYGVRLESTDEAFGGALHAEWESPSVPIPIGGPIPLTVRLRARATCSVMASGEITATSRVHLRGHAAAGFNYNGGLDIEPVYEKPSLTSGHDFVGVTGKASLIGECKLQGVVSLLAFDAAGLEGAVGPFATLNADLCATAGTGGVGGGFTIWEQHGLGIDVLGRLQVPGLGTPSTTKDIFGFQPLKSEPRYLVGDKGTCEVRAKDSCVDKPDGLYCSDLATYSAYECLAGQIVSGQQCEPKQSCTGPNGKGKTIQCK